MWVWFLIILFLILAFASWPTWPYSRGWGYYPGAALLVLVFIILILWWLAIPPFYYAPVQPVP